MKTRKKDYYALTVLAEHLKNCKDPVNKKLTPVTMGETDEEDVTTSKTVLVQKWVFDFLPDAFDVWYFDSWSKEPKFGPAESSDTLTDVCEFFEIERVRDFETLFCNTKSCDNDTCAAIANSIERFVSQKLNEA